MLSGNSHKAEITRCEQAEGAGRMVRMDARPKRVSGSDGAHPCVPAAPCPPLARAAYFSALYALPVMSQYVPVFANSSQIFLSVASCAFSSGFALIAAISALNDEVAKPCSAASKSTTLLRGTLSM